jgi:RNA polymerase sigma-70 factor (ECF subfamily)
MGISVIGDESQALPDLLVQARTGDARAFCRLAEPLQARLWQQAVALCGDPATAGDLVSETLVEAWKSLARYDATCRFTTWLYAILLHRHQKLLRHRRSRPVSLASLPVTEADARRTAQNDQPAADATPLESILQTELHHEIRAALNALDEKHRQVVWLRFFEDASLAEMALLLGCSEGTVKSRLHYALNKLRQMKFSLNQLPPGRNT